MSKNKISPVAEQWPAFLRTLGLPESWQQFLDAETIRVEQFRDGDTLVVRAELPGIDPERDVDVTIADGMLRIHAERTQRRTSEPTTGADTEHARSEFRYGAFTRVLALPAGTADADVTATYTDGILEVRVPTRPDDDRSRKVAVTRS